MTSNRPYAFVKAIEFTLPWECGREKDGSLRKDGGLNYLDDGLPTKYGIYKKANPEVDVENLTFELAIEIYKKKYWDVYSTLKPVSASLDNLPIALAVAVFDAGVNCGTGRAIKWLGKALEAKNPAKAMNDLRGAYYFDLVSENKEKYFKDYKGWMARVADLKKLCDVLEIEAQTQFELNEKVKKVGKLLGFEIPSTGSNG